MYIEHCTMYIVHTYINALNFSFKKVLVYFSIVKRSFILTDSNIYTLIYNALLIRKGEVKLVQVPEVT